MNLVKVISGLVDDESFPRMEGIYIESPIQRVVIVRLAFIVMTYDIDEFKQLLSQNTKKLSFVHSMVRYSEYNGPTSARKKMLELMTRLIEDLSNNKKIRRSRSKIFDYENITENAIDEIIAIANGLVKASQSGQVIII